METVKTLFKLTSWTNWAVPLGIIIKTGQFKLNFASSAMLIALKGLSVIYKLARLYLNSPVTSSAMLGIPKGQSVT